MTSPDPHPWPGVSAAAAVLGVSIDTIRELFDEGALEGVRTRRGHRLINPESLKNYKRSLSVSETARELHCAAQTVRRWFDEGDLWGHRTPGGYRRIDPEAIEALRRERTSS